MCVVFAAVASAHTADERAGDVPRHGIGGHYWKKYHADIRRSVQNMSTATNVILFGCIEWCRKFGRDYLCMSYRRHERRALHGLQYEVVCNSGDTTNNMLWGLLHGELPPAGVKHVEAVVYIPGPYNLVVLSPMLRSDVITPEQAAEGWLQGAKAVLGNLTQRFAPRARVITLGVLPHGDTGSVELDVIARLNRGLQMVARATPRHHWVDCTHMVLKPEGGVDCSLIDCEPGHAFILTPRGYQKVMSNCLAPRMRSILSGTPSELFEPHAGLRADDVVGSAPADAEHVVVSR